MSNDIVKTFYKVVSSEGYEYYCRPNEVQELFDSCFEIKLDDIPEEDEEPFSLTITGVGMTEKQFEEYEASVAEGGD